MSKSSVAAVLLSYCNYRPQRSCGQGNIFTRVCHSFCSQGGGGLPQCMLGYHPSPGPDPPGSIHPPRDQTPPWDQTPPPHWDQTPPGADTHLGADPPREQTPPRDQTPPVYERPVRILLEYILVGIDDWLTTGLQSLLKLNFHSYFFRVASNLLLETARVGASSTSAGNPFN